MLEARVLHRGFPRRAMLTAAGLWPYVALAGGGGDNAVLIIDPSNADPLIRRESLQVHDILTFAVRHKIRLSQQIRRKLRQAERISAAWPPRS